MSLESPKPNKTTPSVEKSAFLDERGVEQPFSKEGLLNRNYGKDPTVPSDAVVFSGGILNRAKVERDKKEKQEKNGVRERLGLPPDETPIEGETVVEQVQDMPEPQAAETAPARAHEASEMGSIEKIEGPSMRDRFLERVESNKRDGIPSPAWAALGSITAELQADATLSQEERVKKGDELSMTFSSYQRNVRESQS